jgi:hypothetical protein
MAAFTKHGAESYSSDTDDTIKHAGLSDKSGSPSKSDAGKNPLDTSDAHPAVGEMRDKEASEGNDTSPPAKDQNFEKLDADAIIDAFLEANPDMQDTPVEEWPDDTIEMLRDTFNTEHVDAPNGFLPQEENAAGEPDEPAATASASQPEPEESAAEQDFDIAELSKLVEAGDKDGAWSMLQNMFGVTPDQASGPTNALEKMTPPSGGNNALAKIIGGLKF